ncbi:MAG: tetratricopeptide repeat protein [Armatimonadota bacterium]
MPWRPLLIFGAALLFFLLAFALGGWYQLPLLLLGAAVLLYFLATSFLDWHAIHRPLGQAQELIRSRDFSGALSILERVARARPWSTPAALHDVYYPLGAIYALQGQHERAIEQFLKLLNLGEKYGVLVPPATVAEAKGQIAASYDALGQAEAASEMRRQALASFGNNLTDPVHLFVRGRLLKAEWRYREAADCFAGALELSRYREPAGRLEMSLEAALASYECGRTEDTLRFAREGLALGLPSTLTRDCAALAGIAARLLRRPEESVAYHRQAYELAMARQDLPQAVNSLVMIATVDCFEGRIEAALAQLRDAGTLSDDTEAQRWVEAGWLDCYVKSGRLDEARASLQRLHSLPYLYVLELPELLRGLHGCILARLEIMAGNLDQARAALDPAEVILRRHEKQTLSCRPLSAWLHALAGERDRALAEVSALEELLPTLENDWETCPSCCSDLGKACCHLGEYDRAVALLQRWPEEREQPVNLPERWYYLGECYHGLGNPAVAREMYARAAGVGFETHYTRLAAERLHDDFSL